MAVNNIVWSYRFWLYQFSFKLTKCNVNLILEANTANKTYGFNQTFKQAGEYRTARVNSARKYILIGRYPTTEAVPITSTE